MIFTVTVLDMSSNRVVSEKISADGWYNLNISEFFSLPCGIYGLLMKIERVIEPDKMDIYDSSDT